MLACAIQATSALAFSPLANGQLLVSVALGKAVAYDQSGKQLGSITNAGAAGMCFDGSGGIYVTSFDSGSVGHFDHSGKPAKGSLANTTGAESCVVMRNGNILAGQALGDKHLIESAPNGKVIASFRPAIEDKGIDWIDLAPDQCTVYYTSEGNSVKRFDICRQRQLADFATHLQGHCYAQRLLANGGDLVACDRLVYRLNPNGTIVQTYTTKSLGETGSLFALNLDPEGQSFWTASFNPGTVYKVDLASGKVLTKFAVRQEVDGLAVIGEPLAGTVSVRSSFATVVPDLPALLAGIVGDPPHAALNLGLVLLSLLGIAFTKEIFNHTVRENYEEIRRWFRFWPPIERRLLGKGGRPAWLTFIAFAVVGGILYSFLEPHFLSGLGLALAVVTGMSLAIGAVELIHVVVESRYAAAHGGGRSSLRFFPLVLPVAIVCVVISRLVDFQPGYIYGVFVGLAFTAAVAAGIEAGAIARAAWATLAASVIAWILWIPLESLTAPGAPFVVFVVENFLVLVFVLGLEALLFGLLPLQFLEGEKLFAANRWHWAAIWGLSAFLAMQVLINPSSRGRFVVSGSAGVATWLALLIGFFALTAGLWLWFRTRRGAHPPTRTELETHAPISMAKGGRS